MRKSVIAVGLVVSLALAGTAAQAASTHARTSVRSAHVVAMHAPAHRRTARVQLGANYAQLFQMMFSQARALGYAGPLPNVWNLNVSRGSSASSNYDNSAYDTSSYESQAADAAASAAATVATTQADDAAADAGVQMSNDAAAQAASMAAAEEQNDAANAATLQTELNANN